MKVTKFKEQIQHLSPDELRAKVDALRRDLFTLRLNSSTAHVKDYSQFKKNRKNIARVLTDMRSKGVK